MAMCDLRSGNAMDPVAALWWEKSEGWWGVKEMVVMGWD